MDSVHPVMLAHFHCTVPGIVLQPPAPKTSFGGGAEKMANINMWHFWGLVA